MSELCPDSRDGVTPGTVGAPPQAAPNPKVALMVNKYSRFMVRVLPRPFGAQASRIVDQLPRCARHFALRNSRLRNWMWSARRKTWLTLGSARPKERHPGAFRQRSAVSCDAPGNSRAEPAVPIRWLGLSYSRRSFSDNVTAEVLVPRPAEALHSIAHASLGPGALRLCVRGVHERFRWSGARCRRHERERDGGGGRWGRLERIDHRRGRGRSDGRARGGRRSRRFGDRVRSGYRLGNRRRLRRRDHRRALEHLEQSLSRGESRVVAASPRARGGGRSRRPDRGRLFPASAAQSTPSSSARRGMATP